MSELEDKLRQFFKEKHGQMEKWADIQYVEDINPDAKTEAWLDSNTSYIWKVGALTAIDSNKCDWIHVIVGHQRKPDHIPFVIGEFYFQDGENDDPARTLSRIIDMLPIIHPVFYKE